VISHVLATLRELVRDLWYPWVPMDDRLIDLKTRWPNCCPRARIKFNGDRGFEYEYGHLVEIRRDTTPGFEDLHNVFIVVDDGTRLRYWAHAYEVRLDDVERLLSLGGEP
jgi:hypothetical protein